MSSKESERNIESSIKRLEDIVKLLEEGNVSLDEAVKLYEEGLQLSKFCSEKLRATELRLKKLTKDASGQFELSDMEE